MTPDLTPLRVAVVGTGFIAGQHLRALRDRPDVAVVAVADADGGRARAAAEPFGAQAYDDGLALLASERLDAVWLCVPPFAHGPFEHACLDRGLPFFVEKPLAADLDTATAIADRVREQGLPTAVGYHWRHLDVVAQAAELLRDSPPHLVTGYWLDKTPAAPWWSRRDQSGGQVLEQTTHILDLTRLLVGEVDSVTAAETRRSRDAFPEATIATASTCVLRFRSGALGTVSSTCVLDWRHRVALSVVAEGLVVEVVERGLRDHDLRIVTEQGERVITSDQDPIAAEDAEFLDAVRGGRPARVPYEEALRTHRLAWAVDRSARDGSTVGIASDLARA